MKKYWRIPPTANAAFVACMEDVLDVYCRAYDAHFPVVCMDETSRQLIGIIARFVPRITLRPHKLAERLQRTALVIL